MTLIKSLSLLLCGILSTTAWIQNLGHERGATRLSSRLRLANNGGGEKLSSDEEAEESIVLDNYRAQLERTFRDVNLEEEDYFIVPYDASRSDGFDMIACEGRDCEQCDIPEDFKVLPNVQPVDVMTFLGIRRAEPLRVKRDWE